MSDEIFARAVSEFVSNPSPPKAMRVIDNCRNFVIKHAVDWQNNHMSMFERVREIMAEMFLILLEDFRPEKSGDCFSLLSYLGLKLRRLTRPRQIRSIAFGLSSDMADLGRHHFSPLRLQLTGEIVLAVRSTLAAQAEQQTGLLEFLFIHVFPEITWASRVISSFTGEVCETRHEADRKRHQTFNRTLREKFNYLQSGDWREIHDWSSGERSYLAERIIDFVPKDFADDFSDELERLDRWRSKIDKHAEVAAEEIRNAATLFRGLQMRFKDDVCDLPPRVREDAAVYGDDFDLLAALLKPAVNFQAAESSQIYQVNSETNGDKKITAVDSGDDFERAAAEINQWLQRLLSKPTF